MERADCGVCGAPLNPAVNVELTRRSFTGSRIVVATRCCGSRRHAKWQEWSNETVSFGSAGLRRTTGRGQADERQASDQSSKTCQQMALRRC